MIDRKRDRRLAVERAGLVVLLRTELDARLAVLAAARYHVFQVDDPVDGEAAPPIESAPPPWLPGAEPMLLPLPLDALLDAAGRAALRAGFDDDVARIASGSVSRPSVLIVN